MYGNEEVNVMYQFDSTYVWADDSTIKYSVEELILCECVNNFRNAT
jgi:hypothetical protein